MASQWIINNKKVKDWTIGGKKVKSITLANGKVLNFETTTPSAPTIKHTEYTSIGKSGNKILFNGLNSKTWTDLGLSIIQEKPLPYAIVVEIKNNFTNYISTPQLKLAREGYEVATITIKTVKDYEWIAGHKYQFESGKDPVDLGTY